MIWLNSWLDLVESLNSWIVERDFSLISFKMATNFHECKSLRSLWALREIFFLFLARYARARKGRRVYLFMPSTILVKHKKFSAISESSARDIFFSPATLEFAENAEVIFCWPDFFGKNQPNFKPFGHLQLLWNSLFLYKSSSGWTIVYPHKKFSVIPESSARNLN